MTKQLSVGCIGFGEAAKAFCGGWTDAGASVHVYDIKTDTPGSGADQKWQEYAAFFVHGHAEISDFPKDLDAVFSLVTADQAGAAARAAAKFLGPQSLFLDCNSCSPQTKQRSAAEIEAHEGTYVDVAVMAPVAPKKHRTPLLVSGEARAAALDLLARLTMSAADAGPKVGAASSTKLVRSIMVKGLEALTMECFVAGRLLGVEETVLATLEKSYPGFGWSDKAAYNFDRVMVHGVRRAAEMRESVEMLAEIGLPNRMARATAEWQEEIGALRLDPGDANLQSRADSVLGALKKD